MIHKALKAGLLDIVRNRNVYGFGLALGYMLARCFQNS